METSNARAAGLKMCHLRVVTRCFDNVASAPTLAVNVQAVEGPSTKPTIMPESIADDGSASDLRFTQSMMSSTAQAPNTAAAICGSATGHPTAVAPHANSAAKM